MTVSPIQTSFTGGVISPRVRGRVESSVYRTGLATCENFQVLPQGPLRMRAGSQYIASTTAAARLIPFRVSGSADDYVLALYDNGAGASTLKMFSRSTGTEVAFSQSAVTNGTFDTDLSGWAATVRSKT